MGERVVTWEVSAYISLNIFLWSCRNDFPIIVGSDIDDRQYLSPAPSTSQGDFMPGSTKEI